MPRIDRFINTSFFGMLMRVKTAGNAEPLLYVPILASWKMW